MAKNSVKKAIFDFDPVTGKRRVDVIYTHELLPVCSHHNFGFDARDEVMKCITCEMEMLFQTEKEFDALIHRYIPNWDFKAKKQIVKK
jgi:hypothetical protein